MARRQRSKQGSSSQSGVKGPNSALTEFCNEGITDAFRQREQREQSLVNEGNENDNDTNEPEQSTSAVEVTPEARRRSTSISLVLQWRHKDTNTTMMTKSVGHVLLKENYARRGSTRQPRNRHDPDNSGGDDSRVAVAVRRRDSGDPNFSVKMR